VDWYFGKAAMRGLYELWVYTGPLLVADPWLVGWLVGFLVVLIVPGN
jgi:hypothetical protein